MKLKGLWTKDRSDAGPVNFKFHMVKFDLYTVTRGESWETSKKDEKLRFSCLEDHLTTLWQNS